MARKPPERDLLKMIWNNFVASLWPRVTKRKLIGEDMHGTKYYEGPVLHGSKRKHPARYYEPLKHDFPDMPAEWESWLRYRRREPPTPEEIERNMKLMLTKKANAAALDEKYGKKEPEMLNPGNYPVYKDLGKFGRDPDEK